MSIHNSLANEMLHSALLVLGYEMKSLTRLTLLQINIVLIIKMTLLSINSLSNIYT